MVHIPTGMILPRNYGIHVRDSHYGRTFVQPLSYALAQIMLERPQEIRLRLQDYSERRAVPYDDLEGSFIEAVKKREGTKNLLNFSRRIPGQREKQLALQNMVVYRGNLLGKSKTKSANGYVRFSLRTPPKNRKPNIAFSEGRVNHPGNFYDGLKGDFLYMNHHLAAAHILLRNEWGATPDQENSTGIKLKEAFGFSGPPKLPFTFNFFDKSLEGKNLARHQALTDLVMNYYLEEQKQYDANNQALDNPLIYGLELAREIYQENGRARFEVIREEEQTKKVSTLNPEEKDFYEATKELLQKIHDTLTTNGFLSSRYAKEPGLGVARRYESKGQSPIVYHVVVTDDGLPLLVKRTLGEKAKPWYKGEQATQDLTQLRDQLYTSIDDVTRRTAQTRIILPDKKLTRRRVSVPPILQKRYDALRRQA